MNTKLTFRNIPSEILPRIFQHLGQDDLNECRQVCRSWYSAAHLLYMKKVHFPDNESIDLFLKDVEDNESARILKMGDIYAREERIDAEHATELFACVSGVKELYILDDSTFDVLVVDEEVRKTITKTYPDLEKVYCNRLINAYNDIYYSYLIADLQHSLTNIQYTINDTHEFLSGFTNLQKLDITESIHFMKCEGWLPLFEKQFKLKQLQVDLAYPDENGFMEQYMESKTQEQKDFIIDRLSSVQILNVKTDLYFDPYSIQFITQYLKAVKELTFFSQKTPWSALQRDIFCQNFVDYVCRMEKCNVKIWDITEPVIASHIPLVIKKVFNESPEGYQITEKTLQLQILYNPQHPISNYSIEIKSAKTDDDQLERRIELDVGINADIIDALTTDEISSLDFRFNQNCPPSYISLLQRTLNQCPHVKKLSLKVQNKLNFDSDLACYPQIAELELSAMQDVGASVLFKCVSLFPEIKGLKLNAFFGTWTAHKNEFHLPLQNIKLQQLDLDVSKIVKPAEKFTKSYFILDVITDKKRHQYQVSNDYLRFTAMETDKLDDNAQRLIVSIQDVESINLRIRSDNMYVYKIIVESKITLE